MLSNSTARTAVALCAVSSARSRATHTRAAGLLAENIIFRSRPAIRPIEDRRAEGRTTKEIYVGKLEGKIFFAIGLCGSCGVASMLIRSIYALFLFRRHGTRIRETVMSSVGLERATETIPGRSSSTPAAGLLLTPGGRPKAHSL